MKKINLVLVCLSILYFGGCSSSNEKIKLNRTGVITKIDKKVLYVTLNDGMQVELNSIDKNESVGDIINLEIK